MTYYSARALVVCIVDDSGPRKNEKYTCDYPFFIFKAKSDEKAFERAVSLGRKQETTYKNNDGNDVRWALVAIEVINRLGDDIDGIEVGSLMDVYEPETEIDINTNFIPESKTPYFSNTTKD